MIYTAKLGEKESEKMGRRYGLNEKGTIHVIFCIKDSSIQTNKVVPSEQHDQSQFYKELDGKMNGQTESPDRKGSSKWLKKVNEKLKNTPRQENFIITVKELKQAIARMYKTRPCIYKDFGLESHQSMYIPTSQTQTTSTVCECLTSTYVH